jgi:CBS domain-containing protein
MAGMTTFPTDKLGPRTVGAVMRGDAPVVSPEDTLGEVAEKMSDLDIGSALVAEYGRLVGIITSRDLLRALAGRTHSSEARVRQWMTEDPVVVGQSETLAVAAELLREHGFHHLPVVEGERPVGMIGLRDVVRQDAEFAVGIGLGL